MIDERRVHLVLDGVPLNFERRRYGRGPFYTWVEAHIRGQWRSLGDPWPGCNPARAELRQAIQHIQEELGP